jgi:hypothetical protein
VANTPKNAVRDEYASWLATPRRLKVSLNLPLTKKAFAEFKGVNQRTLTRWEGDGAFQEIVEQRKMVYLNSMPNSTISKDVGPPRPVTHGTALKRLTPFEPVSAADDPVFDASVSADEQRYMQVKDTLVRMAMDGNQQAIDLYMKHYGKPFVEAEQRSSKLFAHLSDDDLRAQVLKLIGLEFVSNFFAQHAVDA